jgi:DNA-binding response OmpR family regulator
VKNILIVEDQPDVLRLLEVVLRAEDRQVFLADNGEEAVRLARETRPAVILMDVMLPGKIDGYEASRLLKTDPVTAGCAIIIMTAKVQEQDRIDAFATGADDYIGKPFDLEDLKKRVETFLGGENRQVSR